MFALTQNQQFKAFKRYGLPYLFTQVNPRLFEYLRLRIDEFIGSW